MSAIETVAQTTPADYQLSSGTSLLVPLFAADDGDVHFAHVGYAAASTLTMPSGWFLVRSDRSGSGVAHIAQEVWAYIVASTDPNTGGPAPASLQLTWSAVAGEKWCGVTTLRYTDVNALITAADGYVPGEPDVIMAVVYAYAQVLDALPRGESAFAYSYAKIINELVQDKGAFVHAYVKVLDLLLQDKGAFTYSYVDVQTPP